MKAMMVSGLLLAMAATAAPAAPAARRPQPDVKAGTPVILPRTATWTVHGPSGDYRLYLYRPASPPPPQGYPILYLLDGDESFPMAAATANGVGQYLGLQPGVIVGIGYVGKTRRTLDDTPAVPPGTDMIIPAGGPTGGADRMLDFIADTVKPMIAARVPVDRNRQAIAGYSLGGLFALHALFTRPGEFQTYVASSPSIWFGQKQLLTREPQLAGKLRAGHLKARLFLSAGEYEQEPRLAPGAVADAEWQKFVALSGKARMIDNARELAGRLRPLAADGLAVAFKVVPGETHATGDYGALRDALTAAFAKP